MDTTRTRTPQEIWDIALGEIQVQVSRPNFRTWFRKTAGLAYAENVFTIGVPNTFAAEYLEKNQRSLIEKVLLGITGPGVAVAFQVNGNGGSKPSREATLPQPEPSFTRLNPHYTFDTFVEGAGNRLARAAAIAVSQNPGHSYNPLFIHGGAGLGKTHLLHAIGREAAARHINVICTSAEQFTNEFVTALRERTTEEFRAKYRSIGMLLIDDIHFISGKEQTEESFFHTFNELHNTNRQIVMTSDRPPKSMPLLEERLRSRFEWGLIVDIQPPDFETRLAILESKARQKEVQLDREVLEMIARDNQPNVRTIEGMLNRVVAYANLLRVVPTPEIAAQALEDVSVKEIIADSLTPASIMEAVAGCFQLSLDELVGRKRDKETSMARRLAMYLIRQETNCSLAQIGREMGHRDAAAVTSACKLVAENLSTSPYLKRKIRDIQRFLSPEGTTRLNN
jgi:chromosomal replication initiator protein